MAGRPLRNSEVLTHDVSGETVVYHLTSDTVHALDEATAGVWRVCDGERTTRDLVAALKADGLAPTVTLAALDELERVGLLVPGSHTPGQDGVSRRRLLRNVGVGAVMVPTIMSVLAPDPAAAQSPRCGGPGATCTDDTGCCPGYLCVDGHCVDEAEHDAAARGGPGCGGPVPAGRRDLRPRRGVLPRPAVRRRQPDVPAGSGRGPVLQRGSAGGPAH